MQLEYEKGFYQSSNGNKKYNLNFNQADRIKSNGNGFYKLYKTSHYWLITENQKIDIKSYFSNRGVKLIKKVRNFVDSNIFLININNIEESINTIIDLYLKEV